MNYYPYYLDFFNKNDGLTPSKIKKECFEFLPQSTEQLFINKSINILINSTKVKFINKLFLNFSSSINNSNEITIKSKFDNFLKDWKENTALLSDITKICTHPSYQQIIEMGELALPLLINELKTDPDHWFWALKAITGEDPVPKEKRGNLKAMCKAWIDWSIQKGI